MQICSPSATIQYIGMSGQFLLLDRQITPQRLSINGLILRFDFAFVEQIQNELLTSENNNGK